MNKYLAPEADVLNVVINSDVCGLSYDLPISPDQDEDDEI